MLSSCCRQIRPHLAVREEYHGFSRVVAGTSGFRLSCDQDLGNLSCWHSGVRPPFELQGVPRDSSLVEGNRASSRIEEGNSVFLSCWHRDLRIPIKFQQGSQDSSHAKAWNFAFLSSCKRGVRPPLELRQETWAFSTGATWESDFPYCYEEKLGVPFKSLLGNQDLCRVEGILRVLSTCDINHGVPLQLQ